MSKEHLEVPEKEYLKALDRLVLKNEYKTFDEFDNDYVIVRQALQRLEAIDNAKPSEALKCLERIREFCLHRTREMSFQDLRDIEQALLKSHEQEKVLEVIKNKEVDMKLFFNALFREQQYKINPLEFYNGSVGYKRLWLTQEEFESVKRYFE